MNIRDKRQQEFSNIFINSLQFGILHLIMRFGKIKTSINIMKELKVKKILILYPLNTIKKSWEDDFAKFKYKPKNVTYSNYSSVKKLVKEKYDLVITDEIHDTSEKQREYLKTLFIQNKKVLGLSGSISPKTEKELLEVLNLPILANYTLEKGITDGIITDYSITVVKTELDNTLKYLQLSKWSKDKVTEKVKYDKISRTIAYLKETYQSLGFQPIFRMNVIKDSIAKIAVTKKLIKKFEKERVIIYTGTSKTADCLGIPVYHSLKREEVVFNDFCNGKGNHLAVIDLATSGVTIKPIQKAIFNYFNSNSENIAQRIARLIGIEYDTPGKKADVWIICTKGTQEEQWLKSALEMFSSSKVRYIEDYEI